MTINIQCRPTPVQWVTTPEGVRITEEGDSRVTEEGETRVKESEE